MVGKKLGNFEQISSSHTVRGSALERVEESLDCVELRGIRGDCHFVGVYIFHPPRAKARDVALAVIINEQDILFFHPLNLSL